MPNDFFVRITHSYEALRSLVGVWALECEKMAVYEHVGTETEKVHCHMVILRSRITKKQLRNIGQKFVTLKGNEYCSFKACESWETPMTYMTKGELEPKYYIGFTKEECDAARSRWVEPAEVVTRDRAIFNECFYENGWWDNSTHPKNKDCAHCGAWENRKCDECLFNPVKKRAIKFCVDKYDIWNMRAMNVYKMLVYTYAFKFNVPIPKEQQWGKWL